MSAIAEGWQATLSRVAHAARAVGRDPASISVLAVSKTFPVEAVVEAMAAGASRFGENYVQEGVAKIVALRALRARDEHHAAVLPMPEWHFIGPIQGNKSRAIAEHFDWVHSIERLRIAQRLSEQRPEELPPLQVCAQVNISREASKSGASPQETLALCHAIAQLPRLRLRGLMAIPEPESDPVRQRAPFAALRALLEECRRDGLALDTLSMGMSADLEAAVAEGATIVRVGSAIFGRRAAAVT